MNTIDPGHDQTPGGYPPPSDYAAPWPVVADWWWRTYGTPACDEAVARHAYARALAAWRYHAAQQQWQAYLAQAPHGQGWGGSPWLGQPGYPGQATWPGPPSRAPARHTRRNDLLVAALVALLVLVPLVVAGLAIVGWSGSDANDGPVPSGAGSFRPSSKQVEYFLEVGSSIEEDHLVRWDRGHVDVAIDGASTPDDRRSVAEAVAEIDRVVDEPQFSFSDSTSVDDAEIVIRFLDHDAFLDLDVDEGSIGWCNTNYSGFDYSIRHAAISIDTSPEFAGDREGVIYHELGHAIGLDDVYKSRWNETIMFYTVSSPNTYTTADLAAIRILYDARLDEGDTTHDVRELFSPQ